MNDTQRTALIEQTQAELEHDFAASLRGEDVGIRYVEDNKIYPQDAFWVLRDLLIDDTELYNLFAALMHVPDAQAFVTAVSKAYAAAWAEEVARAIELENKIV